MPQSNPAAETIRVTGQISSRMNHVPLSSREQAPREHRTDKGSGNAQDKSAVSDKG